MSVVEFTGAFTMGALCMLAFLYTFDGVMISRIFYFDDDDDDDLGHQH